MDLVGDNNSVDLNSVNCEIMKMWKKVELCKLNDVFPGKMWKRGIKIIWFWSSDEYVFNIRFSGRQRVA